LLGQALNHDLCDLSLLSSSDYRHEPEVWNKKTLDMGNSVRQSLLFAELSAMGLLHSTHFDKMYASELVYTLSLHAATVKASFFFLLTIYVKNHFLVKATVPLLNYSKGRNKIKSTTSSLK
jgi:hypothetical protein